MRFAQGFEADRFFLYLRDALDVLLAEGAKGNQKMMSVGLHCRLVGKAGRIQGLTKFLDYVKTCPRVWVCKRVDIARHWHFHHQPSTSSLKATAHL